MSKEQTNRLMDTSTPNAPYTPSRRRLLKILAAVGGAVAGSALLPSEWVKPVVEVGIVPAHAQATSPTATPTPTATSTPTPWMVTDVPPTPTHK